MNYETPQGKSMFGTDFKYVDENAVRLDLDDLGGEIVSYTYLWCCCFQKDSSLLIFVIPLSVPTRLGIWRR